MRLPGRLSMLVGAGCLAWAGAASSAEPPPQSNAAVAEALFRHGRELLDAGKVAEACDKFAASQRADPALGTLLNLAACHERQGLTATAWSEFTDALGEATRTHDKRATYARGRLAALEQTLFRLVIEVSDPPAELAVRLDGQPLGREALGTPLPVNPGDRVLEATAPGRERWTQTVPVPKTTGQLRLEIPALAMRPPAAPVVVAAPAAVPSVPPPIPTLELTDQDRALQTRHRVGLAVGAGGAVLVGVGAAFGLKAMGRHDDSKAHCQGTVCDPAGVTLNHDAKSAATVSTIAFGVGLAAVAGGAWLLFVPPKTESGGVSVAPLLGAQALGLAAQGRF
jgi:serine/threonine-protein kinase